MQYTHRIRRTSSTIAAGAYTSSMVAATSLSQAMPASTPDVYVHPSGLSRAAKGTFGEQIMERVVPREFLKGTGNWASVPPRNGPQGLDGLFLRTGSRGNIRPPLVVEAKFNKAQLGYTKDGRQMSESWVRPRLADAIEAYRTLLWGNDNPAIRRAFVPEGAEAVPVPLGNGKQAQVWKEDGTPHVFLPDGVSSDGVRSQMKQVAQILEGVAEGKVTYRGRIFRYRVVDGNHEITLQGISRDAGLLSGENDVQVISGKGDQLPGTVRDALKNGLQATLEQAGLSTDDAKQIAEHCVDHPEHLNQVSTEERDGYVTYTDGHLKLLKVSVMGGAAAAGMTLLRQVWKTGSVNWTQTGQHGIAGMAGAGAAHATGTALHWTLVETEVGQKIAGMMPLQKIGGQSIQKVFGITGGSIVGSAVYLSTLYVLGSVDRKQAARQIGRSAAQVVAAKGAGAAAVTGAAAYGTASTGTAIASLSGAAAQNATLAWWGGGSLASGGFGMSGGLAVLGGIGTVAGLAAIAATGYIFRKMDKAERRTTVKARLSIVAERVARGEQAEWV